MTNLTSKEAKMGKVMRHTLGASLNIRHNLSSSKGPKPLQLKLLTTYIPKTSAFTLAFSTSQRLRTTRASARTFFTIFVILVVWFLLPRVARLMIHTPTAISIFVCLSMVQLMAVFISMRCTLCGHFLQVALTLILVVGYAIAAS